MQTLDKRKTAALDFLTSISTTAQRPSPTVIQKPPPTEVVDPLYSSRENAVVQFLGNIDMTTHSNLSKHNLVNPHHFSSQNVLDTTISPVISVPVDPLTLVTSHQMEAFKNGELNMPENWNESRMILCSLNGALVHVFSVIPMVDKSKPKRTMTKAMFGGSYFERMGLGIAMEKRRKAESFAHLLEPSHSLCPKSALNSFYNPDLVDDPEFQTGRNKTVITLPCFKGSIIQHWKVSEVNKAQNEYLKERLPGLDPNITLGEIRDLKSKILEVGMLQDLELSSIASAFVFFEKLLVKNFINYSNRKIVAGNCLLLAAKVNDPKELDYNKVLDGIEKVLDVSPKEIYAFEFAIYAALEFALFTSSWEIAPHIDRILGKRTFSLLLNALNRIGQITLEEYLGTNSSFYVV